MTRLRILTFNIAHGRGLGLYQGMHSRRRIEGNLRKVARLVDESEADVVAFQEIDFDANWSHNFDQLEYMRGHTGLHHSAFGLSNVRSGRYRLHYGNALLSRHPIRHWEAHTFGTRKVGGKGFLYAELLVHNKIVPVINLHLDYRSRSRRLAQADRITHFIGHKQAECGGEWLMPPILCGDLNNQRHRPDATARLLDYFRTHGHYTLHPPPDVRTFPSIWPRRAIDFVFLPPVCHRPRCTVPRALLSDHRPVFVDFTV